MAQDKHFGGGALCEGVLEDFGLKTTNRKKRLAFSIAEAMITLLIVSLGLAAAAPIMSRSIKNNVQNNVQYDNNSKWTLATNKTDIYRKEGRVGIGEISPSAKLNIDAGNALDGLRISSEKRDWTTVDAKAALRVKNGPNDAVALYHNGDAVFRGMIEIDRPNNYGARALSIKSNGQLLAYIDTNGDSSFIPVGAIITIYAEDGVECPNPSSHWVKLGSGTISYARSYDGVNESKNVIYCQKRTHAS